MGEENIDELCLLATVGGHWEHPGILRAAARSNEGGVNNPWLAPVPHTATLDLPEMPAAPTAMARAQSEAAHGEAVRQYEERMLVRLRLDLRHIVDELLKARPAVARIRPVELLLTYVRVCSGCCGSWWDGALAQNRKYSPFARPVDPNVVPDYYDIVKEPMDLSLIQENIDLGVYLSPEQFMKDLQLIVSNVVRYNPRHDPNRLVHRAHAMLVCLRVCS